MFLYFFEFQYSVHLNLTCQLAVGISLAFVEKKKEKITAVPRVVFIIFRIHTDTERLVQ